MLELKSILIRNYWSYGDYPTELQLDDLGPCLITGGIVGDDVDMNRASNGAGKSALLEAILWCLFGRTMRIPNPGSKVVNWDIGKDCVVELRFKNGDMLRRTRCVDGHDDLLLIKDGETIKENASLGTSKMEQQRIKKLLDLDWDFFCGSTFFSQFGQSWMEISDTKRKEAMEREFRLDKVQTYSDVAKEKLDAAKNAQRKLAMAVANWEATAASYQQQVDKFTVASTEFVAQKQSRIKQAKLALDELIAQRDAIELLDVDKLRLLWKHYNAAIAALPSQQSAIYALERQKRDAESDIARHERLIAKWKGKGTVCSECEQPIAPEYVAGKTGTPQKEITKLSAAVKKITKDVTAARAAYDVAVAAAEDIKPDNTIAQAEVFNRRRTALNGHINKQNENIKSISDEQNHYDEMIAEISEKAAKLSKNIVGTRSKIAKFDKLILHLNYIYRAYHDRRKIKSYILSEYIPFLNSRIKYYLRKFKLDLDIEFTSALGTKPSKWGYRQFSGGECKRFDVAMMLAMFDLHTLMYGRCCNIIVFDEIDGRLDPLGAEIFADIVRTDFAGKVDSVLVISQRLDMRGAFGSEVKIINDGGFSRIAEIVK